MQPPDKRKPAAGQATGFLEIMSSDRAIQGAHCSEVRDLLQELRVRRRRPDLSPPVARLLAAHCFGRAA